MDLPITLVEDALRLTLALVFGGIIGWERETRGRTAGLRTHMLVAMGSAGFTLVAMRFFETHADYHGNLRVDPLRIIQGVVGGIGFLGAGAIVQARGQVRGLTTAAGLWVVAAVGVASGVGLYAVAGIMVVFALIVLVVVRLAEKRLFSTRSQEAREDRTDAGSRGRADDEPPFSSDSDIDL